VRSHFSRRPRCHTFAGYASKKAAGALVGAHIHAVRAACSNVTNHWSAGSVASFTLVADSVRDLADAYTVAWAPLVNASELAIFNAFANATLQTSASSSTGYAVHFSAGVRDPTTALFVVPVLYLVPKISTIAPLLDLASVPGYDSAGEGGGLHGGPADHSRISQSAFVRKVADAILTGRQSETGLVLLTRPDGCVLCQLSAEPYANTSL